MVGDSSGGRVSVREVCKGFTSSIGERVETVDRVSLEIEPGEFLCLMGPSGCGKTTLLRIVAGLLLPDSGSLSLDGAPITGPGPERGLVFQNPELFKWMNVEQNVAFGLKARGVYKEEKEKVGSYLKLVGLEGFEKALPHHLSGGMQQRVAFARALVNQPKVLLLDEPFGALDAFTRAGLQEGLIDLWKALGTTVVMVTHDVEEAVVMGTRIAVMSPRPARVRNILPVDLPYPRDRNDSRVISLKRQVLAEMSGK